MAGLLRVLLLILWAPLAALAQSYPDRTGTTVNDFAGLLERSDDRAALEQLLAGLRRDTGIEMTVATIPNLAAFAPDIEMERFATGLFNHWGIGDAQRNDGILVLVLPEDRALRIELGAGYGRDWNAAAGRIVQRDFLPAFRDGRYAEGILAGSRAVVTGIARPFAAGRPAPLPSRPGNEGADAPGLPSWLIAGLFVVAGAGLAARRRIGDLVMRTRPCPKCGRRGTLHRTRRTISGAGAAASGIGERVTHCTECDYRDVSVHTLPPRRSRSGDGGGSGGGRSGGGGASGRW